MRRARRITTLSMLLFLTNCAGLQHDHVQFDPLLNCPQQTAVMLVAKQSQFSALSDTHTLTCALAVLRANPDPTVRRTSLGSRLCLYLAERESNPEKREKLASEGVDFAEAAVAEGGGDNGEVHYYLAANLGLAVREHITVAVQNLGRLEDEMKRAVALSPDIDDGGPLRLLGALYVKAPAWPNGIGDSDKALELLKKAVVKHPGHPLNHLFYAQALWDEDEEANLAKVTTEFALGKQLLDEGNWGYSKEPWQKEFDAFQQELGEVGAISKDY